MNRLAGFILGLALALPAAAQVTPPPATPDKGSTPWNSSTTPQPPRLPAADSTLSLRIYDGLNETDSPPYRPGIPHPPGLPGRDDRAYAVDVSAVMTRCADGSLVITALVIGGQLTPLDNRCPAEPASRSAESAPACDANRWNCTTTGATPGH